MLKKSASLLKVKVEAKIVPNKILPLALTLTSACRYAMDAVL
jgi:hypothetical protein